MSTPNIALQAALAALAARPPVIWPTNEQILRAIRGRDRSVVRILVDEPTLLGLAFRTNSLGGWSSMQFKLNTPEQLAFNGEVVPIV